MKISFLTVGRTDAGWVREGLETYISRLGRYVPFSVKEIPELKNASSLSKAQVKEKEGESDPKNIGPKTWSSSSTRREGIHLPSNLPRKSSAMMAQWQKYCIRHRRPVRFLRASLCQMRRESLPFQDDFHPPDGPGRVHRATLQGIHHHQRESHTTTNEQGRSVHNEDIWLWGLAAAAAILFMRSSMRSLHLQTRSKPPNVPRKPLQEGWKHSTVTSPTALKTRRYLDRKFRTSGGHGHLPLHRGHTSVLVQPVPCQE